MLQEVMHSHSISVVEEAVLEPSQQVALTPAGRRPRAHPQRLKDACDCFVKVVHSQPLPALQLWVIPFRRSPME